LLPYKPSGWDNSLVVTKTKGSTTTSSTIYSSNTIYLNYAVANKGTENISQTFSIQLLVDGVVISTGTSAGLATNYYTYQKDINIGTLSGGKNHTFEIRIDPNNELLESNESDNVYTITKYIY
jgi:subtilase family serine protease